MTFNAPLPDKTVDALSIRERARLMGLPSSTLHRVLKSVTEKRRQLTAAERGVHWALSK